MSRALTGSLLTRSLTASAVLLSIGCSEYELADPTGPNTDPGTCDLEPPNDLVQRDPVACETEPEVGQFTPVVEWKWESNPTHAGFHQVMAQPVVANLDDDNGDGQIGVGDIPDVVFASFQGGAYTSPGALVAVSGKTGQTLWSRTDIGGHQPYGSTGVAIADLDGDGKPEIVFSSVDGLTAASASGDLRWHAAVATDRYGMPAIADMDGDGSAEVVFGPTVVDASGQVVWTGPEGGGWHYSSYPVDLDGDGLMEVVAGSVIYTHDGQIRHRNPHGNGWTAVGDLDLDGVPEIITVGGGKIGVSDDSGAVVWEFPITDGGGGPPTVADFDGDGAPEIGVASREVYRVVDSDGTQLWANTVQDYSSSITGSSVFDFEGDGGAEVVYADEETLWIYDGATGEVELAWTDHSSGTLMEYPVIVDIDADGSAEIVVASNNYTFAGSTGITVIGDADSSWAAARPIWNQHAYSITHIEDDGSVPRSTEANWLRWNNFRAGNSANAAGYAQPDLAVGEPVSCDAECHADRMVLWIPVVNNGEVDAWDVTLEVDGDVRTVGDLGPGEARWVGPFTLSSARLDEGLVATAAAAGALECDLADNQRLLHASCTR
ncbi:MAG: VCBS repeat-containing protein [Deltaproteobacteria bacterium]|nr:MAG: VCBS repeat-containing protein [Deltaproteobacteria bacterium]